ncbi:MAG: heavy-metal-associated domain-containing protein [Alphaproteobacteria bacterium]|nr:heavy-metal-associated domain-containing protein [Alphaproteobacteria bacterium]NDC56810.1 heavy-metal-associated domain-containing protein [Alphaproteobacteria bacterium]
MKRTLLTIALSIFIVSPTLAANIGYDLSIGGITCLSCVGSAEKNLKAIEGVSSVKTDIDAGKISLCADERVKLDDEQLKVMFAERGFTFKGVTKREGC